MKHSKITQDKQFRTIILIVSIVLGFIFLVAFAALYVSDAIKNDDACGCVIPIPYMILLLSSLGLFVGFLSVYFLMSRLIREKKDFKRVLKLSLQFLEVDERKIVHVLILNKGTFPQAKLDTKTNLHRVKVHRAIEKLVARGIVVKEERGRTNTILLTEDFADLIDSNY
ncbi:hypothetical protein K9M74_04330 [Candidatus Woesearchaeota archaeon]|nr:hypothetical protein [Candidatus Woesearchaeota archaeon]